MDALTDRYGYDETLFISETQDYLHCSVCTLVLRDPVMILCCGHKFCSICFDRIKTTAEERNIELQCPIDREVVDLNQVHEDVALRRLIGNLLVRCLHHERGCEWTGDLRDMKQHADICPCKPAQVEDGTATPSTDQMKQLKGRLDQHEAELIEKDKEIASLKHEQRMMREELQVLKEQQDQTVLFKETTELLEQKILKLNEEREKEREVQERRFKNQENKMIELSMNFKNLKTKQQQQQQQIASLTKKNSTLEHKLQTEITTLTEKSMILEHKLSQLEDKSSIQRNQIGEQGNQLKLQQKKISELHSKVETLSKEHTKSLNCGEQVASTVGASATNVVAQASSKSPQEQVVKKKVKDIVVQHHRGDIKYVTINNHNHTVTFYGDVTTVCAHVAVVPPRTKVWYEVEYTYFGGCCGNFVGWATINYPTSQRDIDEWVGSGGQCYGFDPYNAYKYHNFKDTQWGRMLEGGKGYVGIALDLVKGEILFSVKGQWTSPMGVAFTGVPGDQGFFPAITGYIATLKYNFGDRTFKYGPPDSTFKTLIDVL